MSLLELEHVSKRYGSGAAGRVAVRDVSFEIEPGELVAVWGRRRSGRSTLLRVAAGIERPDSGSVCLEGRDIYGRGASGLETIAYCRTTFPPSEGQLIMDQLVLGQTFEYPGEDLIVDFERQAASGAAQPGVIRHALALAET